jgi:hypothetical protein
MSRDSIPAFVLLAFFAALFAFGARISPAPTKVAAGDRPRPAYQSSAEVGLTGIVTGMPRVPTATSPIVVMLRTTRQPFDLVMAPAAFMASVQLGFVKGDQIRVIGTTGRLNDDDVVFVREVTRGTRTVALRDECGEPLW